VWTEQSEHCCRWKLFPCPLMVSPGPSPALCFSEQGRASHGELCPSACLDPNPSASVSFTSTLCFLFLTPVPLCISGNTSSLLSTRVLTLWDTAPFVVLSTPGLDLGTEDIAIAESRPGVIPSGHQVEPSKAQVESGHLGLPSEPGLVGGPGQGHGPGVNRPSKFTHPGTQTR
jgi:hypothetical protein